MPVIFKHMKYEHAKRFTEGHIRLGSIGFFQTIDNAAAGIKDEMENVSRGFIARMDMKPNENLRERGRMKAHGINVPAGIRLVVGGTKVIREAAPCYIFCTSLIGSSGLFDGYDTVIGMDFPPFEFEKTVAEGAPDTIEKGGGGEIEYVKRTYDALTEDIVMPSPMRKDLQFASQREYRHLFYPVRSHKMKPFIQIKAPGLRDAFQAGKIWFEHQPK